MYIVAAIALMAITGPLWWRNSTHAECTLIQATKQYVSTLTSINARNSATECAAACSCLDARCAGEIDFVNFRCMPSSCTACAGHSL